MTDGFIPAHGGYRDLLSYRKAAVVYDATVRFCERFLTPRDRTVDQMDRQIRQRERAFIAEEGLRERMTRARIEERNKQPRSGQPASKRRET